MNALPWAFMFPLLQDSMVLEYVRENPKSYHSTQIIFETKVIPFDISKIPAYEPPHGKTKNLHMRKQRRRSASR